MTLLDLSRIPSQIDTLEKLAVWAGTALAIANPTRAIIEAAGENPEPVAQFFLLRADDDQLRLILRQSIALDPDFVADDENPIWLHGKSLSDTELPAKFLNP